MNPDFEPAFLKGVMVFGANLRVRASEAMLETFTADDTTGEDRRLLYFAIRQQMCMAMEDVGAYLYAFRESQNGKDFLNALTDYKPWKVYLYNLFRHSDGTDKSDEEIANDFGFGQIPDALRKEGYDEERNDVAKREFVTHFRTLAETQESTMDVCLKLKHGGLGYRPEANDELRILRNRDGKIEPVGIHYNPEALSKHLFVTVMCSIQSGKSCFAT